MTYIGIKRKLKTLITSYKHILLTLPPYERFLPPERPIKNAITMRLKCDQNAIKNAIKQHTVTVTSRPFKNGIAMTSSRTNKGTLQRERIGRVTSWWTGELKNRKIKVYSQYEERDDGRLQSSQIGKKSGKIRGTIQHFQTKSTLNHILFVRPGSHCI